MPRNNRPDDMGARLVDIERRLSRLEASPKLTNASIKDGQLRVYDENDLLRVTIGKLDGGAGWGVEIRTEQGVDVYQVDQRGFVVPWQIVPLAAVLDGTMYRSDFGPYEEVGRADWILTSDIFRFDLTAIVSGTVDFRFRAAIIGDALQTVYEVLGASSQQYADDIDLEVALGPGAVGNAVTIRLEIRATAPDLGIIRFNVTPVNVPF